MKSLVRDLYAGAVAPLGRWQMKDQWRKRLLILTFHRVLPDELRQQYPLPGLVVTPEELAWILDSIVECFDVMSVSDAVAELNRDSRQKPFLAITFDDGQWDNLHYALPVLESRDLVGTFYVPTAQLGTGDLLWHDEAAFGWQLVDLENDPEVHAMLDSPVDSPRRFVGRLKSLGVEQRTEVVARIRSKLDGLRPEWARLMTWDEVRNIKQRGHEIGSHAQTHEILPQLGVARQEREIAASRQEIGDEIGTPPLSFCYPNGSFDADSKMLAMDAGYQNAVSTNWGVNRTFQDRFELLRCDMDAQRLLDRSGQLSQARLIMRLSGLRPGGSRKSWES